MCVGCGGDVGARQGCDSQHIFGRQPPAHADIAAAMMSINAVKGVEIGEGMAAAALTGVENADEIRMGPNGPVYQSNHAGGILVIFHGEERGAAEFIHGRVARHGGW